MVAVFWRRLRDGDILLRHR